MYPVRDQMVDLGAPGARARRRALAARGHARVQVKDVLRLRVADAPFAVFGEPGGGVSLAPLAAADAAELLARTLGATHDRLLARDRRSTSLLRELSPRRRFHRAVARDGHCAGIVLPYLDREHPDVGFLGYVGILPRARRHGLGGSAARLAIRLLAENGATTIVAVADRASREMRAVLSRLGFEKLGTQEVWSRAVRRAPRSAGAPRSSRS